MSKRLWKKACAFLLTVCMLMTMIPVTAWAVRATAPAEIPTWIQEKIDSIPESENYSRPGWQEITDSDLFYYPLMRSEVVDGHMVTDTIVFIAPGDGASAEYSSIPKYDSITESPWGESTVSALYIADGVTGVGNHAFDGMSTLTTLEIQDPADLTTIGEYAFRGCDKLAFSAQDPLSLPNLESLGEYAFSGCERLAYVELGGSLEVIPGHAFNYAGLRDIQIPASVTEIGDYAFANNNFNDAGELVLPEGLETIGSHAFYRNLATGTTSGFTSITIPSTVKTIGDYAFYNHRRLETVTVDATAAGGFEKPGTAAFGTAPTNGAYSKTEDITVGDITYNNVNTGTQFLTKDKATADLFVSGENCFLGNLEPLKFEETKAPTCTEAGYDRYTLTIKSVTQDGQPVTMNVDFPIEKVGHNYERQESTRPATCENPEYYVDLCMNEENGLVPEDSCKEPEKLTPVDLEEKGALGHKYQQSGIENPAINSTNTAPTKITYTCENYSENESLNRHDGRYAPFYVWSIPATTLHASTSNKLSDLTLPTPTGDGNTITAKLEWAEGVDTTSLLTADSHDYQVKLVVTGSGAFPEYTNEKFTIRVQVEKVKLDFSDVEFENAIRFTGQTNPAFAVAGMPEGTTITNTEFCKEGSDQWTTTVPGEAELTDEANYQVRITFSYKDDKYLLVTNDPDLQPPSEYILTSGEGNTATITGAYTVRALTEDDLKVSAVPNLIYQKGAEQDVIQVEGVPVSSTVTAKWMEGEQEQTDTVTATSTTVTIAGITNAGTYPVTVTVAHDTAITGGSVELEPVNGTIAKQTVMTPTANTLEQYTPDVSQTGVPGSEDTDVYTVTGNTAIDAGTHTATAKLKDPANYQWSAGDDNNDGTVEITYTIPKRRVTVPTILAYSQKIEYDGDPHTPLTGYNTTALTVSYDDNGTMIASYQGETVFTATNAKRTDAAKYDVTVSLNNANGKKNYMWSTGSDADLPLNWEITPKQIAAPTVTVSNATYTAKPYDAEKNITIKEHSADSKDLLSLGTEHKYYTAGLMGQQLPSAPTVAGSYEVVIDFVFPAGEKESNYDITGTTRYKFEITKAPLTVTNPTKHLHRRSPGHRRRHGERSD